MVARSSKSSRCYILSFALITNKWNNKYRCTVFVILILLQRERNTTMNETRFFQTSNNKSLRTSQSVSPLPFHLGRFLVAVLVLSVMWTFKLWMRGNLEYHDGNINILINHLIILKVTVDENTYVNTHREIVHLCEDRSSATCVGISVYIHLMCRKI